MRKRERERKGEIGKERKGWKETDGGKIDEKEKEIEETRK